jgi:hypothetical protein
MAQTLGRNAPQLCQFQMHARIIFDGRSIGVKFEFGP